MLSRRTLTSTLPIRALRAVLIVLLVASVFIQTLMVAVLVAHPDDAGELTDSQRAMAIVITIVGVVTIQIVLLCVWRLMTMVQRKTVFSQDAFQHVDVVIGAIVAGALLVFALAVILAPGEAVPPGGILLLGGAGVAVLGAALVVFVLRMLLAQAVARDIEATQMQNELNEVI